MGQFDSPSEGALAQLKREAQTSSPVARTTEQLASIGSTMLELAGAHGASGLTGLVFALKKMAANKDEANLLFFAEATVDDIRRLYRSSEEMGRKMESLLGSDKFNETIANATLHITRTNVKSRLKRLARVVVNSVQDDDLEPESIDDMMWCAVTLTENDIEVLKIVYDMQRDLVSSENLKKQPGQRTNELQRKWQVWWGQHIKDYRELKGLEFQNSCARLEAAGLVGPMPKSSVESPAQNDLELLLAGLRFYNRLRDIATEI